MKIISLTAVALFCFSAIGCGHSNIIRGMSIKSSITHAAIEAQAANADKLDLQLTVVYTGKFGGTYPIGIVPLNASISKSHSTTVKVSVDLHNWSQPPELEGFAGETVWELNTSTGKIKPIKPKP